MAIKDPSALANGVGALVQLDPESLMGSAETSLLRMLVLFGKARRILKDSINVSDVAGSTQNGDIEWSSPEKAWLFNSLVERASDIPSNITGPEHVVSLRSYLAGLPDSPPTAFGMFTNGTSESLRINGDASVNIGDAHIARVPEYVSEIERENFAKLAAADAIESPSRGILDSETVHVQPSGASLIAESGESNNATSRLVSSRDRPTNIVAETDFTEGQSLPLRSIQLTKTGVTDSNPVRSGDLAGSPGILDPLFSTDEDAFTTSHDQSVEPELLAELAVQDIYARMLWTSSMRRLSRQQAELVDVSRALQHRDKSDSRDKSLPGAPESMVLANGLGPISREKLLEHCVDLTAQVRDTSTRVQSLEASVRRISSRLMDKTALSSDAEGRISTAECDKLRIALDAHMEEVDQWSVEEPEYAEEQDERYEDALERVQDEWGELSEDGRMWNPKDVVENQMPTKVTKEMSSIEGMDYLFQEDDEIDVDEDDESLDEFEERIEREWGEWSELL